MYAGGSAGTGSTYRANLQAFNKYAIIPRMLVNANQRSLEVRYLQDLVLTDIKISCRPLYLGLYILHPSSWHRLACSLRSIQTQNSILHELERPLECLSS